jgi:hypothetical protein
VNGIPTIILLIKRWGTEGYHHNYIFIKVEGDITTFVIAYGGRGVGSCILTFGESKGFCFFI